MMRAFPHEIPAPVLKMLSGFLPAISDLQVRRAGELVTAAGQEFTYRPFPQMPHSMHEHAPDVYARTLIDWATSLDE
jgi:hypothetical protein